MKTKLYVIFDEVAQEASQPFQAKNDVIAQRLFNQAIEPTPYKSDMKLFCIAEFDTESLEVIPSFSRVAVAVEREDLTTSKDVE